MTLAEKAWVLSAAAAAKGLYGSSVTPYTAAQLAALRRAFMATLFPKHKRRCPEIVLTLMVQGHRLDPEQIVPYECLRLLWRMVDRRPELRGRIERVWRERDRAGRADAPGPIGRVWRVAAQLGWEWMSPWAFRDLRSGKVHSYARMSLGAWEHEVREAARLAAWRAAETRRRQFHDDFAGIGEGIDRAATMSLHGWKRLTGLERGYLRVIIAGGVYSQRRLHEMQLVPSPNCPHCDMNVEENAQHMWWECPAWQRVREGQPDALAEYDPQWPACLRLNGVMPAEFFDDAAARAKSGHDQKEGDALGTARSGDPEMRDEAARSTARGTARSGATAAERERKSEEAAAAGGARGAARSDGGGGARAPRRKPGAGWGEAPPRWLFR
eukprot:gene19435-biopygen13324